MSGCGLFEAHLATLAMFLSTPSVGRATHIRQHIGCTVDISIRALRGEGDKTAAVRCHKQPDFYPRPPWGGRPQGVTVQHTGSLISIHALRGEGDIHHGAGGGIDLVISIHALRGEGDKNRRRTAFVL